MTGTGFNSYAVAPAGGAIGIDTNLGLAANPDAIRILGGTVTDLLGSTFTSFSRDPSNLDNFDTDNYPTIDSVFGFGSTTLDILVSFADPNFFIGDIEKFSFTTQAAAPFGFPGPALDPSARFLTGSTNTAMGVTPTVAGAGIGIPSIGVVNGSGGGAPDFQLFVDGSSTIIGSVVPEPTSLAVFGVLSLVLLARRKRLDV